MMNFRRCDPCDNETQLLDPVADSKEITSTLSPTTTTQKVAESFESNTQTDTKSTEKQQNHEHMCEEKHIHTKQNDAQQQSKEEENPKITLHGPTTGHNSMVFTKLRIPCPDGTELVVNALLDTGADVAAISPELELRLQHHGIQLPLDQRMQVSVLDGQTN